MRLVVRSIVAWVALLGVFAACSTAPKPAPAHPQAAAPPSRASGAGEGGQSLRRQTVAVLPFSNDGVAGHERLDFLREWLPDKIGASLAASGELRVIERRQLLAVLQEQKLGSSELASKEGRLSLGKMAGAQTLVIGGFAAIGDMLQVTARIVDVESGVVLKSASAHGDVASARDLGEKVTQDLAKDLGIRVARAATEAGVAGDRALAEAELFYEGLAHERRGEIDPAIDSYQKALKIDPNDGEARRHLLKLLGASH